MESCTSFSGELIFAIGVRYILALVPSAKSTVSAYADYCQSVMTFVNVVLDLSLCGNKYKLVMTIIRILPCLVSISEVF